MPMRYPQVGDKIFSDGNPSWTHEILSVYEHINPNCVAVRYETGSWDSVEDVMRRYSLISDSMLPDTYRQLIKEIYG
jgi:hypothetical protein